MFMATITSAQLIVDKVIRVTGRDKVDGTPYFITGQVSDPSLQCDAQEVIKTDAEGTAIARWQNSKTAQFSGSETFWNLDTLSEQLNGESVQEGSSGHGIIVPISDPIYTFTAAGTTYKLLYPAYNHGTSAKPQYKITVVKLNKDGSVQQKFKLGDSAADDVITYTASQTTTEGGTITFGSGAINAGDQIFVQYDFNSEDCIAVFDSADKFPREMEMVVDVLCHPVCGGTTTAIAAVLVFPNAVLSPSVTQNFGRTDTFPFSFSAQQDYCDSEKLLFKVVCPTLPEIDSD